MTTENMETDAKLYMKTKKGRY